MHARYRLQFLEKAGCLLQTEKKEWQFRTTLEALEFARNQRECGKALVEVFDEEGNRFMVLKL